MFAYLLYWLVYALVWSLVVVITFMVLRFGFVIVLNCLLVGFVGFMLVLVVRVLLAFV